MTRTELATKVWERLPERYQKLGHKELVIQIVKHTFLVMRESLINGEILQVHDFGTFKPQFLSSQRSWSHTQKKVIDSRPYLKVQFSMGRRFKEMAKKFIWEEKKGDVDG